MMNDEMQEFERRLSRQPLRQIPGDWRGEILAAAGRALKIERPEPIDWPSALVSRLSTLLWPHPVAWAGLAAVWIGIFAVDLSTRDRSPAEAQSSRPPAPEIMVQLRQQQRMLAELIGSRDVQDADRSKIFVPRPRSERAEILAG